MPLDLVCPAGSVVALKAAVDTAPTRSTWGSTTTPTRRLPRPQFRRGAGRRRPALRYAHDRGRKVLLALNTYPQPDSWQRWTGAVEDGGTPDLTITASARDFLLSLARRENPDTLFFSRRLVSEGDTELGLVVKNLLDAPEPARVLRQLPAPVARAAQRCRRPDLPLAAVRPAARAGERPEGAHAAGRSTARTASPP